MTIQDLGARCDNHAGEAFRPRCTACDDANRDLEQQQAEERHQRAIERNLALGITTNRTPRRHNPRRR